LKCIPFSETGTAGPQGPQAIAIGGIHKEVPFEELTAKREDRRGVLFLDKGAYQAGGIGVVLLVPGEDLSAIEPIVPFICYRDVYVLAIGATQQAKALRMEEQSQDGWQVLAQRLHSLLETRIHAGVHVMGPYLADHMGHVEQERLAAVLHGLIPPEQHQLRLDHHPEAHLIAICEELLQLLDQLIRCPIEVHILDGVHQDISDQGGLNAGRYIHAVHLDALLGVQEIGQPLGHEAPEVASHFLLQLTGGPTRGPTGALHLIADEEAQLAVQALDLVRVRGEVGANGAPDALEHLELVPAIGTPPDGQLKWKKRLS